MNQVQEVLKDRATKYGPYSITGSIAQELKSLARSCPSWGKLTPAMAESVDMVMHKLARILNGDVNYIDNWVDIAGYSQLIVNELEQFNVKNTK